MGYVIKNKPLLLHISKLSRTFAGDKTNYIINLTKKKVETL